MQKLLHKENTWREKDEKLSKLDLCYFFKGWGHVCHSWEREWIHLSCLHVCAHLASLFVNRGPHFCPPACNRAAWCDRREVGSDLGPPYWPLTYFQVWLAAPHTSAVSQGEYIHKHTSIKSTRLIMTRSTDSLFYTCKPKMHSSSFTHSNSQAHLPWP